MSAGHTLHTPRMILMSLASLPIGFEEDAYFMRNIMEGLHDYDDHQSFFVSTYSFTHVAFRFDLASCYRDHCLSTLINGCMAMSRLGITELLTH